MSCLPARWWLCPRLCLRLCCNFCCWLCASFDSGFAAGFGASFDGFAFFVFGGGGGFGAEACLRVCPAALSMTLPPFDAAVAAVCCVWHAIRCHCCHTVRCRSLAAAFFYFPPRSEAWKERSRQRRRRRRKTEWERGKTFVRGKKGKGRNEGKHKERGGRRVPGGLKRKATQSCRDPSFSEPCRFSSFHAFHIAPSCNPPSASSSCSRPSHASQAARTPMYHR